MADPIAEVISVGTELLLGQILDSHAQAMARILAECGIGCHRRQTVGDNLPRVVDSIKTALARADIVVTIGGLGPTDDDLTRPAIAQALGDRLVRSPEMEEKLRKLIAVRKLPYFESLMNQADRPESATFLENPNGSAPGLLCEKGGKVVIALPGPPSEFNPMATGPVREYLVRRSGGQVIFSRILRICGLGESQIEDRIRDLMMSASPTVAPYAKTGEVHLRVTAKAASQKSAEALVFPMEARIRAELGTAVYGIDEITLEETILNLLKDRGATVALDESMTGGMVCARLTSVPGASKAFLGGIISYSTGVKLMSGVSKETLETFGPVSSECAAEMASAAREATGATFGVSITGNAGPTSDAGGQPVGLVYIGIGGPSGVAVHKQQYRGSRFAIRDRATQQALVLLREALLT